MNGGKVRSGALLLSTWSRHPQESFVFQRLLVFTTKPLEVAKPIPAGALTKWRATVN
jgi:hypothetical protein